MQLLSDYEAKPQVHFRINASNRHNEYAKPLNQHSHDNDYKPIAS